MRRLGGMQEQLDCRRTSSITSLATIAGRDLEVWAELELLLSRGPKEIQATPPRRSATPQAAEARMSVRTPILKRRSAMVAARHINAATR